MYSYSVFPFILLTQLNLNYYFCRKENDSFANKGRTLLQKRQKNNTIICIYTWSKEGDVVYDCFGGSGTTAKMSIVNNRNWIASEISSDYCKIIENRIKKAVNNKESLLF